MIVFSTIQGRNEGVPVKKFLTFFTLSSKPRLRPVKDMLKDSRGAIAVVAGFVFLFLILAAGMAVDGMRMFLMKSELRALTDAAAVFAGSNPENNSKVKLTAAAKSYIDANKNEATVGQITVVEREDSYDALTGKFTLELSSSISALLLKAAGFDVLKATAKAVVERTLPGPVEIAVVVDSTLDLSTEASGTCRPGGTEASFPITKIQDSVNCGVQKLVYQLGSLLTAENRDMVRIGIVPYGIRVNVGKHSKADWLDPEDQPESDIGCVGYRIKSHRALERHPT
jgi:Flp pilus assembly protein TadG